MRVENEKQTLTPKCPGVGVTADYMDAGWGNSVGNFGSVFPATGCGTVPQSFLVRLL